jgi:hypothetical protein
MPNRNILLMEPGYKNKYPPLGLMKLATYHGPYGKKDHVKFIKGETDRSVLTTVWDRVYVTTLFSFEWKEISKSIDFAVQAAGNNPKKVFVGGIAASLMHDQFVKETRWRGVRFIQGLLSEPPAKALQLDEFEEELYSEDQHGTPIEDMVPDYSILDQIEGVYRYPVTDAYFAYASRGCIRKCHFCGVPKLEGAQRDGQSLTALVRAVDERYGVKRDLTLMDNNVAASANYKNIIAEIRDLGFVKGAKLHRPGRAPVQRRVDFNQGVDARILCKDPMYLREMATICLKPLRIAFDHIGVRKPYETAVRLAHDVGLDDLSNYMLYNFQDTPADLYARMHLNIELNRTLGCRIFSFPMRYQPTDMKDRSHVGPNWSRYLLRSMQLILQATHGIVSGSPEYFERAFGATEDEFAALLLRPQHFLFNRDWYEKHEGRAEFEEFIKAFNRLIDTDRHELNTMLSSVDPRHFAQLQKQTTNLSLRRVLPFYAIPSKAEEAEIWEIMRARAKESKVDVPSVPDDERVEDAGLAEAA